MDNSKYLNAKLYMPSVKDTNISREALIGKLIEGQKRGHGIVLVSAEAGYGKTTLVSGWIARINQSYAWLPLDVYDNDPITFISHLLAAIRRSNKEFGCMIDNIMSTPKLPSVEVVSSYIIEELAKITENFIFVFDDYHIITNTYIHKLMQRIINTKSHRAFTVLITRQDPPFSLSRWRAEGRMTEIRSVDLRFETSEMKEFFDKNFGIIFQNEALKTLAEKTEGWVTGLQLIGLSMNNVKKDQQQNNLPEQLSGNNKFIADYLMEEVFAKQGARIRTFLKKTCMLKNFNEELCNAVTGFDNSKQIIEKLEKDNLFIVPMDSNHTWYRYHNLFSDFLCAGIDDSKKGKIFKIASTWYLDKGCIEQAVEYALKARDSEMALSLFGPISEKYLHNGAIGKLLILMNAIKEISKKPDDEVEICRAWCLFISGERDEAHKTLIELKSIRGIERSNIAGKVKALEAILCVDLAKIKAVKLAEEAVSALEGENRLFYNIGLRTLGLVKHSAGDLDGATQAFMKILEGVSYKYYRLLELSAFVNYADCLIAMGRRQEAQSLCEVLLAEYTDQYGKHLPLAEMVYLPMGICCYLGNELEKAKKYLHDGIKLCRDMNLVSTIGNAEAIYVKTLYAQGDKSTALKVVHKYKNLSNSSGLQNIFSMLEAIEIDLYIKEKNNSMVLEWMKERDKMLNHAIYPRPSHAELTYIRALMNNKMNNEAEIKLEKAEELTRKCNDCEKLITILILKALVENNKGDESNALIYISKALQIAVPEGYIRSFLDEGDDVLTLVCKVPDISPDFLKKLIENKSGEATELVEPLKAREYEIIKLIAAGLSNAEISNNLCITTGTVKWYINNIYAKMGVNKRIQAVKKARQLGIIG